MARITQQSSIHTTGISYENEPIIKSDGAGEAMQWQSSDDGRDGIYITEEASIMRLGVGVQTPATPLSVSPIRYNTGTASQSGTTVTGSGTTWTAAMIGDQFVYADGTTSGAITARASNTSITVTTSQTVSSQGYDIHYTGLQVTSAGRLGIGTTAPSGTLHAKDSDMVAYLTATEAYSSGASGPKILFQGLDSGSTERNLGYILSTSTGSNTGELRFATRNAGSVTEALTIDSAG